VTPAVETWDIGKTYGSHVALQKLTFAVQSGEVMGVLGPNGAGKTTAVRVLTTILEPSRGTFAVGGFQHTRPTEIRRRIGVLPESAGYPQRATGEEYLRYHARLYGHSRASAIAVARALLEEVGLSDRRMSLIASYSRGMRQRLGIARALVNDPQVVFLDEPTLGLDPDVAARVRAHIARLRREQGITIVLTTHYMREADELCDEIAFIKGGQILARGTPGELKRQIRLGEVVALKLDPPRVPWLAETPGVLRCVEVDGWVECTVDEAEKRLPEILRLLHADGVVIRNVQVHEPELEEVFVELAR
jgi:ABC-2 type transport system ATP-binding protein